MISVTLNSRKGSNLAVIPTTQSNTFFVSPQTLNVGATSFNNTSPSNSIDIGETFIWSGTTYTITGISTLTLYSFTPALLVQIPSYTTVPIITTNSNILGYKVSSGHTNANQAIGSSVLNFYNSSVLFTQNILSPYMQLLIDNNIYSMSNISFSAINNISLIKVTPPLSTAMLGAITLINVYAKTYNNVSYNIDPSIFEDGKKYELSFSFTSYPCIISQSCGLPCVYLNLGTNSTYETDYNNIIKSNLLGYLKSNFIHSNMASSNSNVLYGNVSYSTLTADPSNKPILISKPSTNNITISILNDDLTPFVDNSSIGLFPPYSLTLHFKEVI